MENKLNTILNYFEGLDIEVPESVKNSIQDVFDENDSVDDVDIYLKSDIDEFATDVQIENFVNVNYTGPSNGKIVNTYTYHGDNIQYPINERYLLTKGENNELEETIHEFSSQSDTIDENEWVVVLLEIIEFKDKELKRSLTLKIYCPEVEDEEQ